MNWLHVSHFALFILLPSATNFGEQNWTLQPNGIPKEALSSKSKWVYCWPPLGPMTLTHRDASILAETWKCLAVSSASFRLKKTRNLRLFHWHHKLSWDGFFGCSSSLKGDRIWRRMTKSPSWTCFENCASLDQAMAVRFLCRCWAFERNPIEVHRMEMQTVISKTETLLLCSCIPNAKTEDLNSSFSFGYGTSGSPTNTAPQALLRPTQSTPADLAR